MTKRMTTSQIFSYFKHDGLAAYVADAVVNHNKTFQDACDNENLYGERADIVAIRNKIADTLAAWGYSVAYKA